jgi:hypothetical protein
MDGYASLGTTCTRTITPPCRDGYIAFGTTCTRTTYSTNMFGVSVPSTDTYMNMPTTDSYMKFSCTRFDTGYPGDCRPGLRSESYDAGVCYPECNVGPELTQLTGVGPVCSATCPSSHHIDLCDLFPGGCGPSGGVVCCEDAAVRTFSFRFQFPIEDAIFCQDKLWIAIEKLKNSRH